MLRSQLGVSCFQKGNPGTDGWGIRCSKVFKSVKEGEKVESQAEKKAKRGISRIGREREKERQRDIVRQRQKHNLHTELERLAVMTTRIQS